MTDLVPWKFGELSRLRDDMDALFNRFFGHLPKAGLTKGLDLCPSVDLTETKEDIVVKAEIPGMDVKDIEISLLGNVLHIKGEKKEERTSKDETVHRIERSYGSFSRSLDLPCDVKQDKIKATYEKGVLKITLPKSEKSKAKTIKINVT